MRVKAKENLAKLIEKFERESSAGRIKDYNEEATKTAFIQTAKGSQKDQIQRAGRAFALYNIIRSY
jgi:hypothetical protein